MRREIIPKVLRYQVPKWIWNILRTVVLIGLCFMILYPVLQLLTRSFMGTADMNDGSVVLIPRPFSMENISLAWQMLDYPGSLAVTLLVVTTATVLQTLCCLLAGYGFARFDIPLKRLLFAMVIFTIVVPPQLYMASTYLHFKSFDIFGLFHMITGQPLNMINSYWPIFLLSLTGNGIKNGLFIYIFRQNFRNMPKEIEEAAYVDGAGHLRIFGGIMVPNAVATVVTVMLFSFVWTYNDNVVSGMLTGSSHLLSVQYLYIADLTNLILKDWDIGDALSYNPIYMMCLKSAGVLLVILPPVLLYLVMQRFFVESVERSGLVG